MVFVFMTAMNTSYSKYSLQVNHLLAIVESSILLTYFIFYLNLLYSKVMCYSQSLTDDTMDLEWDTGVCADLTRLNYKM